MAIPAKQIGRPSSTKAALLWDISKQLETLIKVAGNVYIPKCPVTDWVFVPGEISIFPVDSTGYTLYTDGFTNNDDGQSNTAFPLAGDFYTNDGGGPIADNTAFMSTNGFMIASTTGFALNGNASDLYLTPGASLTDGDTQNFWYQNYAGTGRWRTSMLVYCGRCCDPGQQETPYSYILNIYRDSQYQYMEACAKTNVGGGVGPETGTETPSTATQVWQSDLYGNTWTYLGFGNIQ